MTKQNLHTVYLGLGTNIGNRSENMATAYKKIEKLIGTIVRQSAFYVSEPWGFESENDFLNSVICCQTIHSPRDVLQLTQQIEQEMGRTQKSDNHVYHDRIIDIDILLYDHLTIHEPDLQIPHPLMKQRPFVMEPLKEIIPPEEL